MSGFTQDGVGLVLHRGQHIKLAFLQITTLNVLILFILAATFIPTIIIATTGTNTYVFVLKKITSTTITPVNFGFDQRYTTTEELKVINLDKLTLYSYKLKNRLYRGRIRQRLTKKRRSGRGLFRVLFFG